MHVIRSVISKKEGPGSVVGITTTLRAGRSGDRIPVRESFPHLSRPDLRASQPPVYNGYRVFPPVKEVEAWRRPPPTPLI